MNDLLRAMSTDMNIPRYQHESDDSFIYRLCYSALGQWCLSTAQNIDEKEIGTTKHNQTSVLNKLLDTYIELFAGISERFTDANNQHNKIAIFIRRVYEETGYLLTRTDNRNKLANFGRSIKIGHQALFFGLPQGKNTINGLGVFSSPTEYLITANEFLIRDNLTCEEYFNVCFDPIDFYERDIDIRELEFFNPLLNAAPSMSWRKELETDFSVARRIETGTFCRVMKINDDILFADERVEAQHDGFVSYEYRRLYFALKKYYNNSLKAWVSMLDNKYSKIRLGGQLPNREYYLLLLLAWPERTAFDKTNFIIRNDLLDEVFTMFKNIGIEIRRTNS